MKNEEPRSSEAAPADEWSPGWVEIVTLSSGKQVPIVRDSKRPSVKIGHLLTDREWSGPRTEPEGKVPERNASGERA